MVCDECVLILASKNYDDCLRASLVNFNLYWPDCVFDKFIISDGNHSEIVGFNYLICNSSDWIERLRYALIQLTKYKKFIIFLDDYAITEKVDSLYFNSILKKINFLGFDYCRLINNPYTKDPNNSVICNIRSDTAYAINMQLSIWDREYLFFLLGELKGSAWNFEEYLNLYILNHKNDRLIYINKSPIVYVNTVIRGKWVIEYLDYINLRGLQIDPLDRGMISINIVAPSKIRILAGSLVPLKYRKSIKKILNYFGVSFLTRS